MLEHSDSRGDHLLCCGPQIRSNSDFRGTTDPVTILIEVRMAKATTSVTWRVLVVVSGIGVLVCSVPRLVGAKVLSQRTRRLGRPQVS
jgi:hypothetical protein